MNFYGIRAKTLAYIPENENSRRKWDIDETGGIMKIGTKDQEAYDLLNDIRNFVKDLKSYIYSRYLDQKISHSQTASALNKKSEYMYSNCMLLIYTPCEIQEIPFNPTFEGLNKPKEIVYNDYTDQLTPKMDNEYRASRRLIMLSLRNKSNHKIKILKSIKKTLIHELAHTMCNHCVYREDENHQEDFKDCESFLIKESNSFANDISKYYNLVSVFHKTKI